MIDLLAHGPRFGLVWGLYVILGLIFVEVIPLSR